MLLKTILAPAAALASLAAGASLLVPGVAPAQTASPRPAAPKPFDSNRINVQVTGSGPDVILIPGLTAGADVWHGTVSALPGYRYHLVQVSGFAGTPVRGNARGPVVTPLAAEIARYIEAKGLRDVALVGHSMGGTLAMTIASAHSQRVGKVMVVDMLPQPAGIVGASSSGVRGLADALRGLSGSEDGRRLIASAVRMFGNADSDQRPSDPDLVARATHELALTDLGPALPRIGVPMTIVYAAPDPRRSAAVDRSYDVAYSGKKGARLVRIDNSGHMIMYDQPAKFRAALRAFLAGS